MKKLKESTRLKLLQSAAEEFALHGFVKTSIDSVSINAGFGKGTIYNYFKSKLELFLAVVNMTIMELCEKITETIEKTDDVEKKFRLAIETDYNFLEKKCDLMITVLKETYSVDKDMQNQFFDASYPLYEMYINLIKEGIRTGIFSRKTDPMTTTIMIMAMCEDIALTNKMLGGTLGSSKKLSNSIINSILHGIKKK